MQRVTVAGVCLSMFQVELPRSIAEFRGTVAVGTRKSKIEVHSLATGELLCCFGFQGNGSGQIGDVAIGIRFTPDGRSLLVAKYFLWTSVLTQR